MKNNIKISIVTAVYNGEKYIKDTIESVLNQDYNNIEYIIVDGASTDSTLDIVNQYKDQIDIIISEPDSGVYDAMNKGYKLATGDYILFLNADDYLSNTLDLFVNNILRSSKRYDIYYANTIMLNENYQYILKERNLNLNCNIISFTHPSTLMSINLMKKLDGFNIDYKYSSDYDLFCRSIMMNASIKYIDLELTNMRAGGISDSAKTLNRRMKEHYLIDKANFNFFKRICYFIDYNISGYIKFYIKQLLNMLGLYKIIEKYHEFKNR